MPDVPGHRLVPRWPDTSGELAGVAYAVVDGPGRARAEDALRAGIEMLTAENAAATLDASQPPLLRGRTLMALAVAAPAEPDSRVSTLIADALADPDPYVRRFGLYATGVLGWLNLTTRAETLRTSDPDPEVRSTADEVLGG